MCVISTTTLATIGTTIAEAAAAVGSAAASAGGAIASGVSTIGSTIASGAAAAGSALAEGAATVGSAALSGAEAVVGAAKAAPGVIADAAKTVGTAAVEGTKAAGGYIAEGATKAGTLAKEGSAWVAGEVDKVLAATTDGAKSIIGTTGEISPNAAVASGNMKTTEAAMSASLSKPTTYFGLTSKEWLTAAGLAGIAGGGVTGVMQYNSALAAAEAQAQSQEAEGELASMRADLSRQNALNSKIRAGQEIEAGEMDAADKARIARQQAGSRLAQIAGNGVMIEGRKESVSTMYEADNKAELAYDQAKIMQNAEMRAWGYLAEAQSHEMEALSNDFSAAALRSSASRTRSAGKKGALASAIGQGISTGVSAASLLI